MKQIILFFILTLTPSIILAAGDIAVNNQPTYAVPPGATKILILDLTLPENLKSLKILNLGIAQQWDISSMYISEDGSSAGFDGDENEIVRKVSSPFWDTEILADSSKSRIFVTIDIASTAVSGRTIKPKVTVNSDKTIVGLERTILAGASAPLAPVAPLIKLGQALSTSTIRWNFLDLANNEFGFRIKSSSLKIVAEKIGENFSFIDEAGLAANTCYSGRRVSAFNDRGESLSSMNFDEVCTLAAPVPAEVPPTETPGVDEETPGVKEAEPPVIQEIPDVTIRLKIIEVLKQLIQLLQEQIKAAQASLSRAFESFTDWLVAHF